MVYCFYTRKDMGVENELYVIHILQLPFILQRTTSGAAI
jgi:hypothetical protein